MIPAGVELMPTRACRASAVLFLAAIAAACERGPELPRAVGTLERDRVELVAEAQEPIVEIPVREGQRVQAGGLVVRLEDARLAARLAGARAALDRAAAP